MRQDRHKAEKALINVLGVSPKSRLLGQLVRYGIITLDPKFRAKQIIIHLYTAWRFADKTVSYKLRQRRDTSWSGYRDSWADHARRSAIVFQTFERNRRHDGSPQAVQKAVRGWTRKLTPPDTG
jgi:hypothetical protein